MKDIPIKILLDVDPQYCGIQFDNIETMPNGTLAIMVRVGSECDEI